CGSRYFGLRELRVGLDSMLGDLAMLGAQPRKLAGDRLRYEPGIRQSAGELLNQEIAAQCRVERLRAHSLVSKRGVVAFPGEFPVHLEGGDSDRRLDEHLVGNGEMIPRRVLHHEPLRDHALEHLQAERGRIEDRRIEVPPEHSADAFLLLSQRFAEFLLGDLLPAYAGDFARARRFALGPLDPPERERRHDYPREHELQETLVPGDEIEHGLSTKKANRWNSGGADGT